MGGWVGGRVGGWAGGRVGGWVGGRVGGWGGRSERDRQRQTQRVREIER